jgi:calcineurin-like phosphoesterase family protein
MKYSHRDFPDIEKHDEILIKCWNMVVGKNDTVYHLGDFTFANAEKAGWLFSNLNGHIYILNNYWHHDSRWIGRGVYYSKSEKTIEIVPPVLVLENIGLEKIPVILCHYPFEVWDRKHYGAIHLHGHTHGEIQKINNRLDIGVDNAYKLLGNYQPFSIEEAFLFAKEND